MRAPDIARKVVVAFSTSEPSFCRRGIEPRRSSISKSTKILEILEGRSYIRWFKLMVIHHVISQNETVEDRL
jgi:hypothetical protein